MSTAPTPAVGPITMADVRAALGDTDPNTTNADALRKKVGRGSTATFHKHLEAIRAERASADPTGLAPIPTAPADAVAAIWSAAWSAAQALSLSRLDAATAQRDAARARIEVLGQDLAALADASDSVQAELEAARAEAAQYAQTHAAELTAAHAKVAELTAALAAAVAETDRVKADATHASELAKRDAELLTRQHQSNTEHLLEQVAELKTALRAVAQPVEKQAGVTDKGSTSA